MSAVPQVARQFRFTNKAFWRNPASAFFTFAFPLMFLVIFTSLLGDDELQFQGVELSTTTYYVGAMAAFGVISACFTNIAIQTTFNRDAGILKRLRGTPLPAGAYLTSRVLHAMVVGAILVVITLLFGKVVYDSPIPTGGPLLEFIASFLVGALSFAALALALTGRRPERRCRAARGERGRPATAIPLRHLLPARRRRADVDEDGRRHLPGEAFRGRDASRVPRERDGPNRARHGARVPVRLVGHRDHRGLGDRRSRSSPRASSAGSRAAKGLC